MSVIIPIRVDIDVAESVQQFDLSVMENEFPIEVDVATAIVTSTAEDYTGETEATPTAQEQVFSMSGKRVLDDFVVHPIPSNYGLITYNGVYITVS